MIYCLGLLLCLISSSYWCPDLFFHGRYTSKIALHNIIFIIHSLVFKTFTDDSAHLPSIFFFYLKDVTVCPVLLWCRLIFLHLSLICFSLFSLHFFPISYVSYFLPNIFFYLVSFFSHEAHISSVIYFFCFPFDTWYFLHHRNFEIYSLLVYFLSFS